MAESRIRAVQAKVYIRIEALEMDGIDKNHKATWIWYPNDYELWLHVQVSMKRQFRGYICPPFWRMDTAYSNVMFRKKLKLERPESLTLSVQGAFVVHLDGSMLPMPYERKPITSVLIPAGEHELVVKVFMDTAVPALYAAGETITSDGTWEVTCHNGQWLNAGSDRFDDPASPPGAFPFAYETVHPVHVAKAKGTVLVDFGQETFGYVTFLELKGRGVIRLYYGESMEEALAGEEAETSDELEIDFTEPQSLTTPVTRAFRYVQIRADEGLTWQSVQHEYEYLPMERRGSFRCSDERINRIWEVAVRTLQLTTMEFMYDGMKRDRWVWSGDAYQSFMMNNYVFFDQAVTRRTLVALRGKDPVNMHINTIMDYTFYWFISYHDYYLHTGDLAFISSSYPNMLSLMEFCLKRRNTDGMMEGYPEDWVFIDWADMEKRGEVCAEQLLFCRSLEIMGTFAGLLGDGGNEQKFTDLAQELRSRIFELFWDEERGAFLHGRLDGKINDRILKYPSMFALRLGYLNNAQSELVARNVLLNESVQKITTPFMRYFELEALCEIGQQTHVLHEMREYWGGMLDLGATTFWEEYDPGQPAELQYDMYGDKYRKSLCHAWGAAPLYLLGKYWTGVRPEASGYSQYRVEPCLGGLEWFEGTVPTQDGEIKVFMDRSRIAVFTNAVGVGTLRFKSETYPETNEGEIRQIGSGEYELELVRPAFAYEVRIKHPISE
ncbi:family 78 glycoside hydrolase catalytic domain [Paenibacillus nasutitermitis]|uniref:Alpha-rhamnosidase n=1 Tax=Paenibacillus nasutitermitis TaxID=1652958 RepID=A0A917DY38_9BACL|nr:family 78 glycoside hydrolase catalytic domain [Paenibacillus nasutitermitis]GGD79873.1 alpha-rhamnosidase [Paenibacillus nasutitermitis]